MHTIMKCLIETVFVLHFNTLRFLTMKIIGVFHLKEKTPYEADKLVFISTSVSLCLDGTYM